MENIEFGQNIYSVPVTKFYDDEEFNTFFRNHLTNCAEYLSSRIESKNNKNIFEDTVLYIVETLYFENLEDLSVYLEDKVEFLREEHSGWWGWNNRNVEYQLKAFLVAQDICDSFLKRFVHGGEGEANYFRK